MTYETLIHWTFIAEHQGEIIHDTIAAPTIAHARKVAFDLMMAEGWLVLFALPPEMEVLMPDTLEEFEFLRLTTGIGPMVLHRVLRPDLLRRRDDPDMAKPIGWHLGGILARIGALLEREAA